MPNPSMSWPIASVVPRVGPLFAGSGHCTPNSLGAIRPA